MEALLHCEVHAMDGGRKERLSDSIRDRVRRGLLPRDYQSAAEVDLGDGRACGCCDRVVTRSEVRYEVAHRTSQGRRILIPMHGSCLDRWRDVVRSLARRYRQLGLKSKRGAELEVTRGGRDRAAGCTSS